MSEKSARPKTAVAEARPRTRIRSELESRGVAPALADALAEHLAALAPSLPAERLDALLAGAALASTLPGDREASPREKVRRDLDEVQRLMGGFVDELRKLDEALQLLTSYLTRLKARTAPERPKILH